MHDSSAIVRAYAAAALARCSGEAVINALARAVKVDDDQVREAAAYSLGQIADTSAVDALISALTGTYTWTRVNAIDALVKIGDARAIPALERIRNDPDPEVQPRVVRALHRLRS